MNAPCTVVASVLLSGSVPLSAQDPAPDALWYVDNGTDLVEVLSGGAEVIRVDLTSVGILPFEAAPAPDGRVWIRPGLVGPLRIVEVVGGRVRVTTVPMSSNSATPVRFSRAGDAWIATPNGVLQQFSPAGVPLASFAIPTEAVDATFDHRGFLWIIHRLPWGLVSRVDVQSGAVRSITVPAVVGGLTKVRAAPPVLVPGGGQNGGSIWIVDYEGKVHLLDLNGQEQNTLRIGSGGGLTRPVIDRNGRTWVATPDNGQVFAIFPDASGVQTALNFGPERVPALDIDSRGRVLVHRLDTATNTTRVERIDTQSALPGETLSRIELGLLRTIDPARWHHAMVTDRQGDADGDGWSNADEVLAGTSPWDRQSHRGLDLVWHGAFRPGSHTLLEAGTMPMGIVLGTALAGSGIPIPGVAGELRLLPSSISPATLFILPPQPALQLFIPDSPALVGTAIFFQGLATGARPALTGLADGVIFR